MPPGQTGVRIYAAIDLKSFYASVECIERGLDPLNTNLVVADESRTEKTICLAVSPTLKAYGISGRARLFEVVQRLAQVNARRRLDAQLPEAALAARADIVLANDGTQEQLRRQAGALAARLLAEGERGTDCPV